MDRQEGKETTVSSIHTWVKSDVVCNLGSGNVELDCVVDSDKRVRVANGASIMGHQEGDALGSRLYFLNFAQLVLQTLHFNWD